MRFGSARRNKRTNKGRKGKKEEDVYRLILGRLSWKWEERIRMATIKAVQRSIAGF